jgi:hypothetical protein
VTRRRETRSRGMCWQCGQRIWLRKDGTLGLHRIPNRNERVCGGVGKTVGESGLP